MKKQTFPLFSMFLCVLAAVLLCLGCDIKESGGSGKAVGEGQKPFLLGDLALERQKEFKFTAPATREDLEALVATRGGWVENPLKDDDAMVYAYVNAREPLATVEEARKIVNDFPKSTRANDIILSTLCRMPDAGPPRADRDYSEVDYQAKVTRHLKADAKTFNPLLYSTMYEAEVLDLIGIAFFAFTYDTFESFAPSSMNRSWHTSADRLIDKLVIRDDLTWSDGQPVTAYDIEFTYKAIMTSMVPVLAVRSGTNLMLDVKAYDEHTVVFFHERAMPINVFNMTFSILPKHIYETSLAEDPTLTNSAIHRKLLDNPVVAGQYTVKSRQRDFDIQLERRDAFYMHNGKQVRTKPFFKEVRFRVSAEPASSLMAMNSGDIEIMQLTPEQWSVQTKLQRYTDKNTKATATEWAYSAFWWNMANEDKPFFKDIKVREALYYALDYETLLNVNRHGLDRPCLGVAPADSPWFPHQANIPLPKQDQDRARRLLDEAGWTDSDGDGIRDKIINDKKVKFSFTLLASNSPDTMPLCTLLETCLREIGIECVTSPLEWTVLIDNMQKKKFDAAVSGWGSGADPYSMVDVWGTGATRNNIGYSNPDVDRLFKDGEVEFDRQKRMAIYQEIHQRIYDDYPCLWLYCRNAYYGFNKNIRGLNFYPRSPIYGAAWKEVRE